MTDLHILYSFTSPWKEYTCYVICPDNITFVINKKGKTHYRLL